MWRGRSHVLSTLKLTVATLQRTCSGVESLWSFLHLLWNSHCAAVGVEMVLWAWASAAANPDVLIASWKWCRGLWKHVVLHPWVCDGLQQTDLGVPSPAVCRVGSTFAKRCGPELDSLQEQSLYWIEPFIAPSVAISVFRFLLYFFIKCLCRKRFRSTQIIPSAFDLSSRYCLESLQRCCCFLFF